MIQEVLQELLQAEMDEAVGARKSERIDGRWGYRSGYYSRTLVTRIGKRELRVPQDCQGRFRPEIFERYERSEKALVGAMAEMYVQGVLTRKVKAITEELWGKTVHSPAVPHSWQSESTGKADAAYWWWSLPTGKAIPAGATWMAVSGSRKSGQFPGPPAIP